MFGLLVLIRRRAHLLDGARGKARGRRASLRGDIQHHLNLSVSLPTARPSMHLFVSLPTRPLCILWHQLTFDHNNTVTCATPICTHMNCSVSRIEPNDMVCTLARSRQSGDSGLADWTHCTLESRNSY
jgi:hypothetical protein